MNQKFSWVAWRGAQTLSQITPKIFGSGPFLILQATRKFFPTHFQHVPKGLPHIAIFALTSSYAPKTSNFMIGMLFCWVRINFGWKLSRQFLGIFSMNFALFYGNCLTYHGVWALKIYGFWNHTRPTTLTSCYVLLRVEKSPKKGIREAQSACVQQAIIVYFILCFLLYFAYFYTWISHNLI